MITETIDHLTLSRLSEAGVVQRARVVGQRGGWGVLIKYGVTERVLAVQRGQQMRIFRKFETLVNYLKGVGIARFEVDTVDFDAESLKRHRPDRADAMKAAHEAAAYQQWLQTEVQAALDDPSPLVPQAEVMQDVRALIAQARTAQGA